MTSPGGREAARVSVRVLPDTSGFAAELQRYLDRIERDARINVSLSLSQADLDRIRQQLAGLGGSISPTINSTQLRAELRILIAEINRSQAQVRVRTDQSALGSLSSLLSRVARGVVVPVRIIGIGAAVAAVAELVAALGQAAAGAGALIPAAATGLGAVGAALGVGFAGIGDAFKQQSDGAAKTAKAVQDSAQQEKQAAQEVTAAERDLAATRRHSAEQAYQDSERIADAERQVTQAAQNEQEAQQALNEARKQAAQQIADLRAQLIGAAADQKQAAADLATAQENLARVQANDFATPAERAQAQAAVAEAQAKVSDTAKNYKDLQSASAAANKQGVDGASQVVSAQQRIVETQQQQAQAARNLSDARRQQASDELDAADALVDAQNRVSQAQQRQTQVTQRGADAVAATQQKVTQLAPAARDTVAAIRSLGPAWTSLRLDVQQSLFQGVGDQIRGLATNAIPSLHRGLTGIAGALNQNIHQFLDFAGSAKTASQFDVIFENIRRSVSNLAPAVKPFNDALLAVARVGSSFLPQLSSGLAGFVSRASGALTAFANNGGLKQFIQQALTTFRLLGQVASGLGGILGGVFRAGIGPGQNLLGIIGRLVGGLSQVFNSGAGQSALTAVFRSVNKVVSALAPAILGVVRAVLPAIQALTPALSTIGTALASGIKAATPAIVPLATAITSIVRALAPLLPMMGQMIGQLLPPFAQLITGVENAVGPLVAAFTSALQPILPVLASLIRSVTAALVPVYRQLAGALAPILPVIARSIASMVKAFLPVVPVLGQIFKALIPLIPPIAKLMLQFQSIFIRLLPALVAGLKLVPPVLRVIVPVINTVVNAFSSIIGIISRAIGWFTNLITHAREIPGKIASLATGMLRAGVNMIESLFNGIKNALGAAGNFVVEVGKNIVNAIIDTLNHLVIDPIKDFKFSIGAFGYHHTFQPFGGLPEIPRLMAEGGTVLPKPGGTLALLAEAGRPESVVDTGLLNKSLALQNKLAEKLAGVGTASRPGVVQNIYGAPGQDEATLAADVARRWGALNP